MLPPAQAHAGVVGGRRQGVIWVTPIRAHRIHQERFSVRFQESGTQVLFSEAI